MKNMNVKTLFSRKLLLTLFVWLTVVTILQNPTFTPLNIVINSSQLSQTMPTTLSGISLQGSYIVSYSTANVQAYANSTSTEKVQAYQVTATALNIMAVFVLMLPWVIYGYQHQGKRMKKINKDKGRDTLT